MCHLSVVVLFFFFFNDTATTEIYTLSLHDALPISDTIEGGPGNDTVYAAEGQTDVIDCGPGRDIVEFDARSEEHTSELQSRQYLVCRLLLEKKKKKRRRHSQYSTNCS